MTSRQRLMTAWQRDVPDRIPIHIRGVNVFTQPRHPSYELLHQAVAQMCDLVRSWGGNTGLFLSATREVRHYRESHPGCHQDFMESHEILETPEGKLRAIDLVSTTGKPGFRIKYFIDSREDVRRFLSIPYEPVRPDVRSFFEQDAEIGERGIVIASIGINPMYHVNHLMGSEMFAIWSIEEREVLIALIEVMFERCRDYVQYLLDQGVGPCFGTLGQELATAPLHSPKDFNDFCTRFDKPLADLIHERGGMLHIHCHGSLRHYLDAFIQIGTDCLHPMEAPPLGDIPLAEAKSKLKGHVSIEGNIQIGDIYARPEGELREIVRQAIRDGGPDGFILCPTASPFTPTLDESVLQNYLALIEEGQMSARY